MKSSVIALLIAACSITLSDDLNGQAIVLNARNDAQIAGLSFRAGDFVRYDIATETASIFFSEDNFGTIANNDINPDAVSVREDGSFLFSPRGNLSLNGVRYDQRAIVDYNPTTQTADVLFRDQAVDIAGVAILPNGNLLVSAKNDEVIAGQEYSIGDVLEYNPETDTASVFFSADNFLTPEEGGRFTAPANIDAVDVLSNGNLLFSTTNSAQIGTSSEDAVTVFQGGVYEFDFATGQVSTFLDPSVFDGNVDVKSFSVLSLPEAPFTPIALPTPVAIPEPSSAVIGLLAFSLIGTLRVKRKA